MSKKQTRRRYTDEFKDQAVQLAKSLGRTAAARQLDISVRSLENWIADGPSHRPGGGLGVARLANWKLS